MSLRSAITEDDKRKVQIVLFVCKDKQRNGLFSSQIILKNYNLLILPPVTTTAQRLSDCAKASHKDITNFTVNILYLYSCSVFIYGQKNGTGTSLNTLRSLL